MKNDSVGIGIGFFTWIAIWISCIGSCATCTDISRTKDQLERIELLLEQMDVPKKPKTKAKNSFLTIEDVRR